MSGFFKVMCRFAWLSVFAASSIAGCASAPPPNDGVPSTEAVLLLATDNYELHLRDGHVFHLSDGRIQEVTDYEQMRELYQREGLSQLPENADGNGMDLLGWRDQECVRKGHACGVEPAFPARDMVHIRLLIP